MADDEVQLGLPGWPVPDPNVEPEFDEWDQQIDETEDEWNERLERARIQAEQEGPRMEWADSKSTPLEDIQTMLDTFPKTEDAADPARWKCACGWSGEVVQMNINAAGGRVCPECGASGGLILGSDPYDPLPGETDSQYDQRVDQQRDEEVRVTACPPPTAPLTIEALEAMAAAALADINAKKRQKQQEKMVVHRETVEPTDYVQESFVPTQCTKEGGDGSQCMMCNGSACRFCGAGCWAPEKPMCEHDQLQRHDWDPAIRDFRRKQAEDDYKKLEMTEARRQEMLAKIFDGEPSRPYVVYCLNCKKEIRTGEVVTVTGNGSRHMKACSPDQPQQ